MLFMVVRYFRTLRFALAVFFVVVPGGVFPFQTPKVLSDTAFSTGSIFRGGQVLVMFFMVVKSFRTLSFPLAVFLVLVRSWWCFFFFQAPTVLSDTALSTGSAFRGGQVLVMFSMATKSFRTLRFPLALFFVVVRSRWCFFFQASKVLSDTALSTGSAFRGGQVLVVFFLSSS